MRRKLCVFFSFTTSPDIMSWSLDVSDVSCCAGLITPHQLSIVEKLTSIQGEIGLLSGLESTVSKRDVEYQYE